MILFLLHYYHYYCTLTVLLYSRDFVSVATFYRRVNNIARVTGVTIIYRDYRSSMANTYVNITRRLMIGKENAGTFLESVFKRTRRAIRTDRQRYSLEKIF